MTFIIINILAHVTLIYGVHIECNKTSNLIIRFYSAMSTANRILQFTIQRGDCTTKQLAETIFRRRHFHLFFLIFHEIFINYCPFIRGRREKN